MTLVKPPPVAAYPDQFELVLWVIFLFGANRSVPLDVAPAPAAAGKAVTAKADASAIKSLRKERPLSFG